MDPLGSGPAPGQSSLPGASPGVWPPPPTGMPFGQGEEVNTSGTNGPVPPEIARLKWNWGAFLLAFLWSVNHRIKWGWGILVLSLLGRAPGAIGYLFSILVLVASVYLGLKGSTMAWQNRRFDGGVAQYFAVQRKWLTWGVAVLVVSVIFGVLGGIGNSLAGHGLSR